MWYVRPAKAQTDKSLCQSLKYSLTVKLLTGHHLEFLKEARQAHLSLHKSKFHIVGNHMSRFMWIISLYRMYTDLIKVKLRVQSYTKLTTDLGPNCLQRLSANDIRCH